MDALILASILTPLLGAMLLAGRATRAFGARFAPWTPLPALGLALVVREPVMLNLPEVLTGVQLGVDATGRIFLLFSALIWLAAGVFARVWLVKDTHRVRFFMFFLLAQTGNFGACLALDAAGFYGFFALMSLAAYGLIIHDGTPAARRAGRVYLAFTLAGEMLILSGLLLALGRGPAHPAALACLILGFGAKTGLPLLHMALPVAYATIPAPGAAVLAGAMIKAGVLGWLRFLPLGDVALPGAGGALMLAGAIAIVYASATGLTQRQPGALLAYSSISQMGHFALGIGAGLSAPSLWPWLAAALALYATHHALAKAALFLGQAVALRHGTSPWVLAGLALPALALAGAPFTSGMLVKLDLKHGLAGLPAPWADVLPGLLAFGAFGSALLMLRWLWLVKRPVTQAGTPGPLVAPWLLLLAALVGLAAAALRQYELSPADLLAAAWPLAAALALAFAALRLHLRAPQLPPGDVLAAIECPLVALLRSARTARWPSLPAIPAHAPPHAPGMEVRLRGWRLAGLLWLTLLALLVAALDAG